jgi:integrase
MDSCRNGHVFVSPGSEKLNADVFLRLFVKLIIKPLAARFPSTEEGSGFITGRFHSFRHAFCSRAVDSQIPQMVILDWLGHKDSSMTRHYYGINNAESKRLMDSVKVR